MKVIYNPNSRSKHVCKLPHKRFPLGTIVECEECSMRWELKQIANQWNKNWVKKL